VNVEAAPLWTRAPSQSHGWGIAAVVIAGSVATAAAVVVGDGNLAVAVAPVLGVLLLGALWLAPLRLPLFALTVLVLGTDATSDGPWDSPLASVGRLLTHNLNKSVPIEALSIPLMALALVYLLLLHLYREASLSRIDRSHALGLASPLRVGLACSFLTVIAEIAYGSRADGNLQMAKIQVQTFVLLLLTTYLMGMSLRGVRDYRILGRLVVAAACSKALMVIWVHWGVAADKGWEVATTHGDSLLFSSASVLLLARLLEQPTRRHAGWAVVLLPLFLIVAHEAPAHKSRDLRHPASHALCRGRLEFKFSNFRTCSDLPLGRRRQRRPLDSFSGSRKLQSAANAAVESDSGHWLRSPLHRIRSSARHLLL
jgi:hypothetical protein